MLGFSIGQPIVSWILRKALGKYIEDIDSRIKDFQYGLSGGNLVLHNLNLKAEALVGLELPIEVKTGHIGLLELNLPAITRIYTEPLEVKVDNVLLLASPVCDRKYDKQKDEALEQARKRETLEKLEQLLEQEKFEKDPDDPITDPGFLETIKITVLQNILVKITSIHIRYEDDVTTQGTPFSFGITLDELSLQPSTFKQSDPSPHRVNKLLALKELSVYWNCILKKEQLLKNQLEDGVDWKAHMSNSISEMELFGMNFDYLVAPINGSADLVINIKDKSKDPIVSCTGCFDNIVVNFKRHMFLNAVKLKDSFAMMRVKEKYRKYHPNVPLLGNTRKWWAYAYNSVVEEVVKPKLDFWGRIWEYRHAYKDYRDLYADKLMAPDKANAEMLDFYEMKLNIESIVMARKEAEKMYIAKKPEIAVVKPANEGMFTKLSNWWYGESEPAEVVVHVKHPTHNDADWWKDMSEEDRKELYKAFNYEKDEPLTASKSSTYVKYLLDVELKGIQINLLIDAQSYPVHVATLFVEDITGKMAVRVQGLKFTSSIKHMEVYNATQPTSKIYLANVDTSNPPDGETEGTDLLSLIVEQYPTDIQADISVKINTLPMRLEYDHNVMCATLAFFNVPKNKFDIGSRLKSLTPEFSTAGLQYAIDSHQRIYVEATLRSPYLVIPSKGLCLSENDDKLIIDLGVLKVGTELRPKNLKLENNSLEDRERLIYDKYTLDVEKVKIMYAPSCEGNWNEKRQLADSNLHLMPALNLLTTVSLSAEPDFNKLPKFKIDSNLSKLEVKLNISQIESLLTAIYTFPHPSAQIFFNKYKSRKPASTAVDYRHGFAHDDTDNLAPAGELLRSELTDNCNNILDEVDFEKLQRLEDKDIFVTQGDLLNLWFLLSKEKSSKYDNSCKPNAQGLNSVADMLLQPDAVRVQTFNSPEMKENGEDVFVLAPEKACLDLPGLDSYTGEEYHTLMHVKFNIQEVTFKFLSGHQEYLTAVVEGVNGQFCRTTCGMSVKVLLNSFKITDDLHLDPKRETLRIAYSPESLSMVSFEGRFIDDVTKIKFTDTAQAMLFNIATIQLCIQDESTKQIIKTVGKISKKMLALAKTAEPVSSVPENRHSVIGSMHSIRTAVTENDIFFDAVSRFDTESLLSRRLALSKLSLDSIQSNKVQKRSRSRAKPAANARAVDVVECYIRCTLRSVKLDVQRKYTIIAKLDVSDMNAEYEKNKAHWSISAKLGALSLFDPTAAVYKNVLVVDEGLSEVMNFHMRTFDQSEKNNDACDQQIEVELRRLKVVYINKFISRLTNFFGEFSSPSTVERVQESSRNKISSTARSAHSKGTKTLIKIQANAPKIIVPESDVSINALLLILGDLHVENEFLTEPVKGGAVTTYQGYDKMTIELDNISIARIKYIDEDKYAEKRRLLTPISTSVVLTRALPPVAKTSVDFNIEANINQFKIEASQVDMQMFGKVLYENVLVQDEVPQSYDVTDVGSTISSALSSTGSSSSSTAKALQLKLCLGGLTLDLKREDTDANPLQNINESLAIMHVAELKLDFCKGKKDSGMSCHVTLRNFAIEDQLPTSQNEFNTNSVVQLEGNTHQILLVKYTLNADGDSSIFCSVERMRFNINLPFVKSMLAFMNESFSTWKSPPPDKTTPQRRKSREQNAAMKRRRKMNTAAVNRRVSGVASSGQRLARPGDDVIHGNNKNSTMTMDLQFGKQSLYMITGDGSQKALVAELNIKGKAKIVSEVSIHADMSFTDMTVYSTSLRAEESHLQHSCLQPCSAHLTYQSVDPIKQLVGIIPPKVDVTVSLTKIDIALSTNLIYHALDALALLKGEDQTDAVSTVAVETNEEDINQLKDIDRDQWLDQYVMRYDHDDDFKHVELNPMKAAVESLMMDEFELDLEFSVAIGEEFVPILRTRSELSASVKDWSTKLRAEFHFSLDSTYYNELMDVWEPLLEPMFESHTSKYRRWEILARLTTAPSHPIAKTDPSEILVNSQELDTFIHHQISSTKQKHKSIKDSETTAKEDAGPPKRVQIDLPQDEVDRASTLSSEDDIFLAPAGAVRADEEMEEPTEETKKRSAPSASGYRSDVILEEPEPEEENTNQGQRLLMSGGPPILLTQPSNESAAFDIVDEPQPISHDAILEEDEHDAKLDEKEAAPEVMCTYLSLVSRDELLLNVTPEALNVVTSVLDTFTKKPKDSTLFEVFKSSPLTITNCLGITACVALHKAMRKVDIKLEGVRIAENIQISECSGPSQQSADLADSSDGEPSDHPLQALAALTSPGGSKKMSKKDSFRGSAILLMRQQLHLQIDGYLPLASISFRRTQSRDFSAMPVNRREESLCLRVRTQSKHGRRHVYIYSQLKVKNDLQCPVQISYQELSFDEVDHRHVPISKVLGTIAPGEMLNIPAMVAQQKRLQVKPISSEAATSLSQEFAESNESLWWKDHLKPGSGGVLKRLTTTPAGTSEFLTCANQLQQTFTFKAVWIPRKCLAEKCPGSCPSFNIILQPTAEVKNFLPFDVKLDIHVNTAVGSQPSSYSLEPGENKHINDSITSPKHCYLIIPSYQGTTWRGNLDIHDRMPENRLTSIKLTSELDSAAAQGSMSLEPKSFTNSDLTVLYRVTRTQGSRGNQGQLQITFFSSYWISNTTGITLQFRAPGLRRHCVETSQTQPILFMPSSMKKKMQLRIPGFSWSKSFSVDAAGTIGAVGCTHPDSDIKHRFMVETTLSSTQLTKIITVFPMFVVLNKLECNLMYRESYPPASSPGTGRDVAAPAENGTDDNAPLIPAVKLQTNVWTRIEPSEAKPFWPTSRRKPWSLVVKREGSEETTSPFAASVPQRTLLPVKDQRSLTAEVTGGLGTEYFITLRPYELGDSVVRIENFTDYTLLFYQGQNRVDTLLVESSKSWLYFWPSPMEERKLFWTVAGSKIKPMLAHHLQDGCSEIKHQGQALYWQVYGDNLQRVMTFSTSKLFRQIVDKKNEKEQATLFMFTALESVGVSLINKESLEVAFLSVSQSPSKWQVMVDGDSKWFPLGKKFSALIEKSYCECSETFSLDYEGAQLEINFVDLRIVQPFAGALKRESFPGIKMQYQKSDLTMAVQASVNHLQIDNQLPDAFYPVVFHPTTQAYVSQGKDQDKPCMHMFLRRQFPLNGSTDSYKAANVSSIVTESIKVDVNIGQFALRIDKGFLLTLIDFIGECRKTEDSDHNKLMREYHSEDIKYCLLDLADDTKQKTDKSTGAKIYVEQLHFSSIMIKLSFSMAGNAHLTDVENTQSTFGGDVVEFLLKSVGMTLTEVTDIEFSLGEFKLICEVLTTDQLSSDMSTFYKSQALRQAYVFVLGLDIIGNPLGLIKDVQRGLNDFFASADPFNKSSKESLAVGIKSAYGNIVGGVAGTASKISESVGRGVNVLTFDKTFQKSRLRRLRSQPSHLPASMLLAGKTFGTALGSGITGIIVQPKRGLEKQGAAGFFKGIGKGVTGVLIKPVGGVFDSISVVFDGFRRATQADSEAETRVRLPRNIIPSEGVSRYHPYLAEGVDILNTMGSYRYSPEDVYWSHILLKREKKHQPLCLATTKTLYLLYIPWYGSNRRIRWAIPIEDLSRPTYSNDVISISRISRPDDDDKQLESEDEATLKWFHKRLLRLKRYTEATYRNT